MKDDGDEMETITTKASKQIIQDVKNIDIDKEHYNIRINKDVIKESVSDFPLMLAKVSSKLDNTLPALLIGPIVTRIVKSQAICLQVDLAGKMVESKKLINNMYSYGARCSYTEYRKVQEICISGSSSRVEVVWHI